MSYESSSVLGASATVLQVKEIVELLGFKKMKERLDIPDLVASYFWYDQEGYRSWTGVELSIYRKKQEPVEVCTRSRSSRSYWDLVHQNKTLKLLRDMLGGHFHSDAGRNRYWRPDKAPPPPISSGCYLARWRFHNNLMRANIYLMNRKLEGEIAADEPAGLGFLDEMNPRLLSNNLLVPYMIAVWEEFFRSMFAACLRYSKQKEAALKRAKLSHGDLEKLVVGTVQIERAVAEFFSFQRPSSIAESFKLLDPKLDLGWAFRKPYRRRRVSLFDSLERLVEDRNLLVHVGDLNLTLFDKKLKRTIGDLTEAVDRAYNYVAGHYGFEPNHDY